MRALKENPAEVVECLAERSTEARLAAHFESLFLIDIQNARIELNHFSNAICETLDAVAVATEDRIFLGERFTGFPAGRQLQVLAHEFSHLAQKKRAKGSTPTLDRFGLLDGACEIEADFAAEFALAGQPYPCVVYSDYTSPSLWGCVGHFWTVWLAYLNAQEDDKLAFKTALYSWMPDQVHELDAKHLYLDYMGDSMSVGFGGHPTRRQIASLVDKHKYFEMVHKGIHCLTGGNAQAESNYRESILSDERLHFILRGMAHHSFGDSFAHRDVDAPSRMYKAGSGHGFDSLTGDDPDEIWNAKAGKNYRNYVESLQKVACNWTGLPSIVPVDSLLLAINPMLHETCKINTASINSTPGDRALQAAQELTFASCGRSERACADHLKSIAARAIGRPMTRIWYDPDRDPKPWADYYLEHFAQLGADYPWRSSRELTAGELLKMIRAEASKWSVDKR